MKPEPKTPGQKTSSVLVRLARGCTRVALLCGAAACAGESAEPPPILRATLALELRDSVAFGLELRPDGTTFVTLDPSAGYGVLPAHLEGPGQVSAFPEANGVLYSARFSLPPDASGPCGSEAIALALSVYRPNLGSRIAGALSAYCGTRATGVPARVLRVSGTLAP